ncbi:MAG: hypothetical protein IJ234_01430 [Clostridia bacterium]|nr:hypothetical protein [Clostridia bacterium]
MKHIILGLKDNRQVFVFVALGAVLIALAEHIVGILPGLVGIVLIAYAVLNVMVAFGFRDSGIQPGHWLVELVLGVVILIQHENAIDIIGVVLAMLTLFNAADEINEMYEQGRVQWLALMWILVSAALAYLLLHDPFEHIMAHIRILGLEMIANAFIRWYRGKQDTDHAIMRLVRSVSNKTR